MDDRFLTPSRLAILRQICQGVSSASAIAKITGISLPYVMTQLQLLEAKNIITQKPQEPNHHPGKPKTQFSLTQPFAHILLAKEQYCQRYELLTVPPDFSMYLQLLSFAGQYLSAFSSYYWRHEKRFKKLDGFAKIAESNKKIEFLAICSEEDLDDFRKKFSNHKTLDDDGQEVTIACWVHSQKEFQEGLYRHDQYYHDLAKKMRILFEKQEVLTKLGGSR